MTRIYKNDTVFPLYFSPMGMAVQKYIGLTLVQNGLWLDIVGQIIVV
jgi:hypothetical protein